jgi:hypothetical protein
LAVKRQAVTPLVTRDVRDQRRRRKRALKQHRGHRSGDDLRHGDLRHRGNGRVVDRRRCRVRDGTSWPVGHGLNRRKIVGRAITIGDGADARRALRLVRDGTSWPVGHGLGRRKIVGQGIAIGGSGGRGALRLDRDRFELHARLVLDAREHHPTEAPAPPHHLRTLLRADPFDLAVELEIRNLDALLGKIELSEIATSSSLLGLSLRPTRATLARVILIRVRGRPGGCLLRLQLTGERVERRELGRELELELPGVDALRLGVKQAPLQQLELELELSKRLVQPVMLGLDIGGSLPLGHKRSALGGEGRLEFDELSTRRLGVVGRARLVSHDSHLSGFDRDVDPQSTSITKISAWSVSVDCPAPDRHHPEDPRARARRS